MSVKDPKEFWKNVSGKENWRDYILPRKNYQEFDQEGFIEAQRLFYFFDEKSVVVDYGCGIGRVAKYVAPRARRFIGLDVNPDFISKAKEYNKSENSEFYVTDEFDERNVADLAYSLMVLQHNDSKNREEIMNNLNDLLKSGGKCIVNFPRRESNYYEETEFVHKFSLGEVELYGEKFSDYRIVQGNLPNYEKDFDKSINHEYFLIAKKK